MNNLELEEKLISRMNALLGLLLIKEKELTIGEKIFFLHQRGLKNDEISKILGVSNKHVSKDISIIKKKRGG